MATQTATLTPKAVVLPKSVVKDRTAGVATVATAKPPKVKAVDSLVDPEEEDLRETFAAPALPGGRPGFQALRPARKRRWGTPLSFLLMVLLPAAIAAWYWFSVAADRYVTTAGFVVRAVEDQGAPDMMGGLTGLVGPTATTSDTAVVLAFLHSRDLVEKVNADVDLAAAWANDDPLYGYKGGTIEDLVEYWQRRVILTHDTTTGLVSFEVEAFDAASSQAIGASILTHTETLINTMSERARRDAMASSEAEVARAEARLRDATEAQRAFRAEAGALNPLGSAEASIALIAEVEARLSETQRQISQLEGRVRDDSPQLERLRVERQGFEDEIARLRGASGVDADLMANFEALELDKTFAQQAYAGALSALEAARARAERVQRYLAIYQQPQTAERAVLPQRPLATFLTALALLVAWGIGALLVRHIRDKMV